MPTREMLRLGGVAVAPASALVWLAQGDWAAVQLRHAGRGEGQVRDLRGS